METLNLMQRPLYSNPNLLDNWYFPKPINQKGQTEYTGAQYFIDRWRTFFSASELELTENGILVRKNCPIGQYLHIDRFFPNVDYTLSMLATNGRNNISVFNEKTGSNIANKTETGELLSVSFRISPEDIDTDNNKIRATLSVPEGATYIAAKLELGTQQTLAHREGDTWVLNDPPPNTALELLKCQRHFQIFATQGARPSKAADYRPTLYKEPTLSTIQIGGATYYAAAAEM